MADNDRDELLIDKYFSYQQALISRRWQYLAVYVVIVGILYNTLARAGENVLLRVLIESTSIIISILLLQFVSLAAVRLEETQSILVNDHDFHVIDIPIDRRFRFKSATILIYLAVICITASWLLLLFLDNVVVFAVLAILFATNLCFLRWKSFRVSAG